MKNRINEKGFALFTVISMLALMASLFGAIMILTRTELTLVKTSRDSASGFNAAEAGLNLRAEEIRQIFYDYAVPEGTPPTDGIAGCDSGDTGIDDYRCETYEFDNNHDAVTFVEEDPNNPIQTTIPPGETFAGLSAQEYRYTVTSIGRNSQETNEAVLGLTFQARWVPLFQFAIFFDEDLEIFNGATMDVDGPVHTNMDLYMAPQTGGTSLYDGQITTAGSFYRGQKSTSSCSGYEGTARVLNPNSYVTMPSCSGSRQEITDVSDWNDNIQLDVPDVDVPEPSAFDSFSDGDYWQRADMRLVLQLNSSGLPDTSVSSTGIAVVDPDGSVDSTATNALDNTFLCPGSIETGNSGRFLAVGTQGSGTAGDQLRLYREYQYDSSVNNFQRTLEVDLEAILNCAAREPMLISGRQLNDETEEGLVFHMTVQGPDSNDSHNNYSVRVRNGSRIRSTVSGAPNINGLTLVSDQGMIVWGDYNSSNWVPSAFMSDTLWLLSNGWTDANSYVTDRYNRVGTATTVQAALVSGIKRTGDANGAAGRDQGVDTNGGGAINVFRFNEWFRSTSGGSIPNFTYNGSIVSLGPPLHSQSSWGPFTYYSAPNRLWSFDERFNDVEQLPPMTPAFVYLRQELFVRDYELN